MNQKIDHVIAHSPSYSYQDLLDRESNPVPESLREDTQTYLGSDDLPVERWTSREFFEAEVSERAVPRVSFSDNDSDNPESGS